MRKGEESKMLPRFLTQSTGLMELALLKWKELKGSGSEFNEGDHD